MEEALFLTNFADKVTLVHRRDFLRADKTNQARLNANKKINVLYDTEIAEVLGTSEPKGVTGVQAAQHRHRLAARPGGAWLVHRHRPFAGDRPVPRPARDGRERLYQDRARFHPYQVAGVFAAGDVKDKIFRQAVTAAGMGCMAALEAERFLAGSTFRGFAAQRIGARGGG